VFRAVGLVVALAAAAGAGADSPRPQAWRLVDLVKLARHRFHAYVGIRPIRLADDGAVYWTAYEQYSDGTTLEVFRWRNGGLSDLGSPGPGPRRLGGERRGQFVAGSAPTETPNCIGPPCPQVRQPPQLAYLWARGKADAARISRRQEHGARLARTDHLAAFR
jgi:hypothetical protein